MENVVLWGCGHIGRKAYNSLKKLYNIKAYGDNDKYKQGLLYKGLPIIGLEELKLKYNDCYVVLSLFDYYEEAKRLNDNHIEVLGYWSQIVEKVLPWQRIEWSDLKKKKFDYMLEIYTIILINIQMIMLYVFH